MGRGEPEAGSVSVGRHLSAVVEVLVDAPEVLFAYLFGSAARGEAGPLSDVDVAVWLEPSAQAFQQRLLLIERLCRTLGHDRVDLIDLARSPVLLRYEVIRDGRVLKEDRERRVAFEVQVLREYMDTAYLRRVQLQALRARPRRREV